MAYLIPSIVPLNPTELMHHNTLDLTLIILLLSSQNRIPEKIELNLYRVIQELTQNVVKHSEASKLDIQLYQFQGNLHLILEDNGKGFQTESGKDGIGLQNIKSRVESMHGTLNYDSKIERGTIVTIKIPLNN